MTVTQPMRRKCSAMATASAAPSSGSVAEPELIQQYQRVCCGGARDEIDVGDVGGERRKVLFDGLVVADIGQDAIEHRQLGGSAGTGMPACAIRASSPTVFKATVLPPVFGPVMTSSRRSPSSSTVTGNNVSALCLQVAFQQWMAGFVQNHQEGSARTPAGGLSPLPLAGPGIVPQHKDRHAAVVFGKPGLGELELQFSPDTLAQPSGSARSFPRSGASFPAGCDESPPFFVEQPHQFVVLVNGFERLDEHVCPLELAP